MPVKLRVSGYNRFIHTNKRILTEIFPDDIWGRQMRFIAGPRQCGKTTLVQSFLKNYNSEKFYYNWDDKSVRASYRENPSFFLEDFAKIKSDKYWLCFDEIHKVVKWKNILKGIFDKHHEKLKIIVTGSARLDLFRKSGDSLAGRYFLFHLYPFSLREINGLNVNHEYIAKAKDFVESKLSESSNQEALNALLNFSGFPEVFQKANTRFQNAWKQEYIEKIIYEDLKDISQIRDLDKVAELLELLPSFSKSPISIHSLAKQLKINHATAKNYLKYLDLSYLIFTVKPYHKSLERSFKKEFKTYFYDWTRNKDPDARFENYVAHELLSMINYWADSGICEKAELFFIRDTDDAKETDFLIVVDGKPWLLIEAKVSETSIASHHYRHSRLLSNIPFVQLTLNGGVVKVLENDFFVMPAQKFFS